MFAEDTYNFQTLLFPYPYATFTYTDNNCDWIKNKIREIITEYEQIILQFIYEHLIPMREELFVSKQEIYYKIGRTYQEWSLEELKTKYIKGSIAIRCKCIRCKCI